MKFELIQLPYATDALAPTIGQQTIELHHGKHLQTYVNNLNNLIIGSEFEDSTLEDIVRKSTGGIFNNAGQILNHNYYFTQFSPNGGGQPIGKISEAIDKYFGNFDKFKKEFIDAGTSLFGSGWVWLSNDANENLVITKEANAGNPIVSELNPILGLDVWEHAYYLDYQNRRADHLSAVWDIIDWKIIESRFYNKQ